MTDRQDENRGLFEVKAREAAARLDRAAEVGRQLSLIPAPASPVDPAELAPRGPGRPAGAKNKRTSKLRQMLAARGFRMPEDVLAELGGLSSRETSVELAMHRAEQVLAWAFGGETAAPGARLAIFLAIFKEQAHAAAAMLPYGLEKMTPDQGATTAPVVLVMPGQAPQAGDGARVIEASASDMAPPPMPGQIERNQQVSADRPEPSDAASRTDGASD